MPQPEGEPAETAGPEAQLARLGLEVPDVVAPLAAYVPTVAAGSLVFTSGQLPIRAGELIAEGLVGQQVTPDEAAMCAQQCALNAIAAIKAEVGDLARVRRVVKAVVFVASAPDFVGQPEVANGASELLHNVFGAAGQHARSAVGVAVLPKNAPVEVELVVEVA